MSLHRRMRRAAVAAATAVCFQATPAHESEGRTTLAANPTGAAATLSASGPIDRKGPFFQSLGANGRSCASCHVESEGWAITPAGVQERFRRSNGTDPIFRTNDGSNSPLADVSTVAARERAYSLLLAKGLVRVGLGMPANADFELVGVDDPYGYASARELSLFRRPLPTTNLRFLSTVMWDGRETFKDAHATDCIFGTTDCYASIRSDLAHQANEATLGHAEATQPLSPAQREAIAAFQTGIHTAQVIDQAAGRLDAAGGDGGPAHAADQPFYFGINDTLIGDYRTHAPFTPIVMTLYDAWHRAVPDRLSHDAERRSASVATARRAVARGQALFNGRPMVLTGVGGLNDDLGVPSIPGTCTTCHNAPNAGNHSIPMPLNIGVADAARRTPDLPLYTLRRKGTGEVVQTTDPGRALISGRWQDIGRFKGPVLRALAARAPYFHNGMAADLDAVVDFYDQRFRMGLTPDEKDDLVAFLRAL